MRRGATTLWGLAAAALTMTLAACGSTGGATAGEPVRDDGNLPLFEATDLDGRRFALADHLGRDVVVMSFWATYCEPCKAEMPVLQRLHERYGAQGLTIVSISLDGPDTVAGVKPFIRRQRYTFPVIVDGDSAITQAYNPSAAAPFTVIIGRDGKIAKRIEGFQPSEAPRLEEDLAHMLGAGG